MIFLHTSDWHLGRKLFGRDRTVEQAAFLDWLVGVIAAERAEGLLVAGDVFDSGTPSHRAQELYYGFLCRVAEAGCRHVVVIAGNHDSPSLIDAPKHVLRYLNVHVIGQATDPVDDEVLILSDPAGRPEAIVCAVPYLRDRDVRVAEAGEGIEDKERKLIEGIREHYARVATLAEEKRKDLGSEIPLIAMGHLFTAGGRTVEGDGVRELYVGSLAHVTAGIFPDGLDYLALGHLHVPQLVSGSEIMRYSGSPIPMGFGEAKQQKSVCRIEFDGRRAAVRRIDVPVFQALERIKGNWDTISARIETLSAEGTKSWIEVIYDGEEIIGDLRERLDAAVSGTGMEILRVKNDRVIDRVLGQAPGRETLDDLSVEDVFARCLDAHEVSEAQRSELLHAYQEAVASLNEDEPLS